MTTCLRPATDGDLALLAALHASAFEEAWSTEAFASLLVAPNAFAILAFEDKAPAGFILARTAAGEAEIVSIAVATGLRCRGIGRRLIAGAAQKAHAAGAESMFLEVGEDNAAARALYGAQGFFEVGRRKAYYRRTGLEPADALVLRAGLPLETRGLGKRPQLD
jgi:[ribosomal protein S18]-alanine N-acetyltransferase